MGRRHFHDHSLPANLRSGLEVTEPGSGRRHYRVTPSEGTRYSGGIADALFAGFEMASKRHFDEVPSKDDARAERRHFAAEAQERGEEFVPMSGRRHVQPPPGHFSGVCPLVTRDVYQPRVRRAASDTNGLRTKRSDLPPQRRHLTREDHFAGSAVALEVNYSPRLGPRRARSPGRSTKDNMEKTVKWESEPDHVRPSRRPLTAPDNLLTGQQQVSRCTPTPRRCRPSQPFLRGDDIGAVLQYCALREPRN
mmetsp:Transcript_3238/g.7194  ORF Transcript_3238/g.7194 Transcript_3238/m.7194 type:complete len:251 (-) Transcript_3238:83-835(-)